MAFFARWVDFEPQSALLRQESLLLCLDPVDDGNVDVRFARPRLVVYSFNDRAVFYDVVQAPDARFVVADVLRANESRMSRYWISLRILR